MRVKCPQHGVLIARVPWARRDSGFTRAFADRRAWLATNGSASVVGQLMRGDIASLFSCKQFRTIQNRLEVLVENTGYGANALVGHCIMKLQHAEAPIQPV